MEDWVHRALSRWPNVPAVYGWLSLTRRGVWCIKGEPITRPQIIDTINANYAADARGCWYFQNGPQRGYMALEYAPLLLHADASAPSGLRAHTGLPISGVLGASLDEQGALLLNTAEGAGLLAESELEWALGCLHGGEAALTEEELAAALALPSGHNTGLVLQLPQGSVPVVRLDAALAPAALGFVREPKPGGA